jgi:hypothetical protein
VEKDDLASMTSYTRKCKEFPHQAELELSGRHPGASGAAHAPQQEIAFERY